MLNPPILRQIWLIIERIQTLALLESSDLELMNEIQKQLEQQVFLTISEVDDARCYIQSRMSLIRDLAENR